MAICTVTNVTQDIFSATTNVTFHFFQFTIILILFTSAFEWEFHLSYLMTMYFQNMLISDKNTHVSLKKLYVTFKT